MSLQEENTKELFNMVRDRDARIAELETRLKAYEDIVSESDGVAGFHLNGDIALWHEFDLEEQG